MAALNTALDVDTGFTLDEQVLARRRADSAHRLHRVQIPFIRLLGFLVLCVMAVAHDLRIGVPFPQPGLVVLVAVNLAYAVLAWFAMRLGYGRTGRIDLSFVFLHLDVLVWLVNLHHLEQSHLFFAYLLLMRVADQVGFGFRRALYFSELLPLAYLAYSALIAILEPGQARWLDRIGIAGMMLLLGVYIALTGLVIERVRNRMRQAVRTARELVVSLEQQTQVLQAQARELERARQQADQANLAKSQFLATISHEIRTPMNGVLGTTELLLGSALTPQQQRYAKTAHRSASALLALIDDVLDLSRIETGKLVIRETAFDLRAVVGEAVELMAAAGRERPVEMSCALPAELPALLEGDPMRLRQVLVNLLHNAIKFTERGRIELAVAVLQRTPRAMRLRFEVSDTGVGIADEQLDSVFDAFVQGDASSTRRHGGSGLGLAIVKELAEAMGGRVGVQSRLGEGSVFWFELPLMIAEHAQAQRSAPQPAGPPLAASVLLVEDDPVNQLVLQEMLGQLGCRVELASDGAQAQAAAALRRHDLVFMDLHMPVMDGYEATRRIRSQERERGAGRTPIVALTADVLQGDRARCLEAGMDECMTKPVSLAQLAAALERWGGRGAAGQGPAASAAAG